MTVALELLTYLGADGGDRDVEKVGIDDLGCLPFVSALLLSRVGWAREYIPPGTSRGTT